MTTAQISLYAKWVFGLVSVALGAVSLSSLTAVPLLPAWVGPAAAILFPVLLAVEGYVQSNPLPGTTTEVTVKSTTVTPAPVEPPAV